MQDDSILWEKKRFADGRRHHHKNRICRTAAVHGFWPVRSPGRKILLRTGAEKQADLKRSGAGSPTCRSSSAIVLSQKRRAPSGHPPQGRCPGLSLALVSTSSASLTLGTFPSRGRLEECTIQGLPLEGKLSAARLTDEVSNKIMRCCISWNDERTCTKTML